MTKRYGKPGSNKHGITDTRTLKLLSKQKTKGKEKCETCDKVVYDSMMEAHEAAIAYNTAFVLSGPLKKVAYECKESPGNFHFGGAVLKASLDKPVETPVVFTPPPMPVEEAKIVEPIPVKDEITLDGVVYIRKSLVPPQPKIMGTVNMNGSQYFIIKR